MVQCTAIRMSPGDYHHAHITHIAWTDGTESKVSTRAEMVTFVEGGGDAYVQDDDGDIAFLRVRETSTGTKYVQTYADGIWKDNLLALPRF